MCAGSQREGFKKEKVLSGADCCRGQKWYHLVGLQGGLTDCILYVVSPQNPPKPKINWLKK